MKARIILLLLVGLCACSKEAGYLSLRAGISHCGTKAGAGERSGDAIPVFWSEGDVISVNGTLSSPLTAASAGLSEAEFRIAATSLTAPYHLLYPGEAGDASHVLMDGLVPPMYASGDNLADAFAFAQASFGVRLCLRGNMPLASISLEAPGGESLTGRFALSFADGSLSPVSVSSRFVKPFSPAESIPDGETFTFFFSPGTFSEGIILHATEPGGHSQAWLFAVGKTLVRGRIYSLPDLSFNHPDGIVYVSLEEMTETVVPFEL